MVIQKKISCLMILMICLAYVVTSFGNTSSSIKVNAQEVEITDEIITPISVGTSLGDFELVLPSNIYMSNGVDIGDGVVSDMNAIIYLKLDNTAVTEDLNYMVTIYDDSAEIIKQEIMSFTYTWSSSDIPWDAEVTYPIHVLTLTDVPAGGVVLVTDIATSGSITDEWDIEQTWNSVQVGVYLTNLYDASGADISSEIVVYGSENNPILLSANGIRTMKFMRETLDLESLYYQTPSTSTFDDEGNHYESGYSSYEYLDKLLNSINVFSFNDIEGTHIVGPIIAGDSAYYKRETPISTTKSTSKLIFSDYSRGIPSYVENITARADGGRDLAANYDYDRDYTTDFIEPIFYTSTSTQLINNGSEYWLQEYVYIPDSGITAFISPNNTGTTAINHNDDYFDFDGYSESILEECINLITDGSIENYEMVYYTYDSRTDGSVLNVSPGESWNITNADYLEQINIILPDGVDYFTSSSPEPLTINFSCETINQTTMDGKLVSQFPLITLNGEEFSSEGSGETIEYNEFGNKLIFNMPYIVTDEDGNNRVVTYSTSQNIPGHLLMPQAEFWNYSENSYGALEWEGGNINGLLLAKDVHLGETEMHMWAYGGFESKFASYALSLLKTVNGIAPQDEVFEFELYPVDESYEGLYTSSFPLTSESDEDGNVEFQNLIFTAAGTYEFIVKEVIPSDTSNMIYDKSEYKLTVIVKEIEESDSTFEIETSITQVKDSEGNDIASEEIESIIFNNIDSSPVFPSTGGVGNQNYKLLGFTFMLLAFVLYKVRGMKRTYI